MRAGAGGRVPLALAPLHPPPHPPHPLHPPQQQHPLPPALPPLLRPPASPPPRRRLPPLPPPPPPRSPRSPRSPPGGGGGGVEGRRALWELGPRLSSEAQRRRALLQSRQFVEAASRGHRSYRESLRPALEAQRRFDRQLQLQRQAAYAELLRLLLRQEKGERPPAKELLAPLRALACTLPAAAGAAAPGARRP